jgi:hypothetical protein
MNETDPTVAATEPHVAADRGPAISGTSLAR